MESANFSLPQGPGGEYEKKRIVKKRMYMVKFNFLPLWENSAKICTTHLLQFGKVIIVDVPVHLGDGQFPVVAAPDRRRLRMVLLGVHHSTPSGFSGSTSPTD